MHILLAHNYYQIPGGEDETFESTRDLLRSRGHRVTEYVRRNDEIQRYGPVQMVSLAARTTWAWDSRRDLARLLAESKPDLAQFTNTFPLISPAAYYACHDAGVPVLQTLENPRLICPAGTFVRQGRMCDDCVGRLPWPAIVHSCYRDSAAQTAVVVAMLGTHRALGTWQHKVDGYLVATQFYIRKFLELGLPADRLHHRPFFVADPGRQAVRPGDYALFLGRLSAEKGIETVLQAWRGLDIPLRIRGGGPYEAEVRAFVATHPNVELVPRLTQEQKYDLICGARFLLWPSLGYYETFGLVVAEAYACGVPVVASRTGIAAEMVDEAMTGIFFEQNSAADLAEKAQSAWNRPDEMFAMGRNGRARYESQFTAESVYRRLMTIYQSVLATKAAANPSVAVAADGARRD